MKRMKRIVKYAVLCLLLCALGISGAQAEGQTDFHQQMPPYLRMTQTTRTQTGEGRMQIRTTYPETASESVNAQMRGLIDAMAEDALGRIPQKGRETDLDVGAVVSRSGNSYMSFLTIAQANEGTSPLFVQVQSRVYDVKTGKRVTLKDVFGEQSEAWALMAQEVRAQLSAAFPGREPDEELLKLYSNPETEEYNNMVEEIRKELHFTSLRYHRLDDMIEATGLPEENLCTYCWSGKKASK